MTRLLLAALLLAALAGCAGLDLAPGERLPTRADADAADLAAKAAGPWAPPLRIKASAALDLGHPLPWRGIVQTDPLRGAVRAVGVADTGLTLFDLECDASGVRVRHLLEPLKRFPDLATWLGEALRRIFVDPFPKAGDILEIEPDFYRLRREDAGGRTLFVLSGDARLLATRVCGEGGDWSARFRDYTVGETARLPARIEYRDESRGGRLVLRIEEVKRVGDGD